MIRTAVLSACALASIAGAAQAATVEFVIVERRGQTVWDGQSGGPVTNDNVLNFQVLAHVVGGGALLGNFGFDIVSNEATANGVISKALISNADGTYSPAGNYADVATVGRGGLARQYSYLAGINPNFNGLINLSGGSFTENSSLNDLGLVTGSPTGQALLDITDQNFDGNPDGFTGATAPVSAADGQAYFGGGALIPVYNFNYTMSSNAARLVTFSLANVQAQTFTSLALANGVWGPNAPENAQVLTVGATASVAVTPAPGAAALLGLGGLVAGRRRRN